MKKRTIDPQLDLLLPSLTDMPLRDQRETMERPFFSLSKRKRLKPIEYTSPDFSVFVTVSANPRFGMATIWDSDVLIWAASALHQMKREGVNDLPRTLHFMPYDLLRTIGRATGGREYQLLRDALARLQSTTVVTNIRGTKRARHRQFSWLDSWDDVIEPGDVQSRGMSITLADWCFEGIIQAGGVLSIDPEYFSITGGRERWLYRVARKHAGNQEDGFAISMRTLFEKSGAEGTFRRFNFEMRKLVEKNALPSHAIFLEANGAGDVLLRMIRRKNAVTHAWLGS